MKDILQEYLEEAELGHFYAAFAAENMTPEALTQLTLQGFSQYGVVSMPDRRKLYGLIMKLRKKEGEPTEPTAQASTISKIPSLPRQPQPIKEPYPATPNTQQRAKSMVYTPVKVPEPTPSIPIRGSVSLLQLRQQRQARLYKGTSMDPALLEKHCAALAPSLPMDNEVTGGARSGRRSIDNEMTGGPRGGRGRNECPTPIQPSPRLPEKKDGYNYGVPSTGTNQPAARGLPSTNDRIRVCVRKRPLSRKERALAEGDVACVIGRHDLQIREHKVSLDMTKYVQEHSFVFDEVFDANCTNEEVYNCSAKLLVDHVFEGGKATCFAYLWRHIEVDKQWEDLHYDGYSSSSLTSERGRDLNTDYPTGLIILAADDIFAAANTPLYSHLKVDVGFFEIYCGQLYDLLNDRRPLNAREDGRGQVVVAGLSEQTVTSPAELLDLINFGTTSRKTGSTGANEESSRSHAIIQIQLRDQRGKERGRFSFIDLAGSERAADNSNIDKTTKQEGAEINQSLLALKECIRALDKVQRHKPFRQSKLTQVLKDSLTGNSKTCMIANISPNASSTEHTLNTLRYADRVKELKRTSGSSRASHGSSFPVTGVAQSSPLITRSPRDISFMRRPISTSCLPTVDLPDTLPQPPPRPPHLPRIRTSESLQEHSFTCDATTNDNGGEEESLDEADRLDALDAPPMASREGILDFELSDWEANNLISPQASNRSMTASQGRANREEEIQGTPIRARGKYSVSTPLRQSSVSSTPYRQSSVSSTPFRKSSVSASTPFRQSSISASTPSRQSSVSSNSSAGAMSSKRKEPDMDENEAQWCHTVVGRQMDDLVRENDRVLQGVSGTMIDLSGKLQRGELSLKAYLQGMEEQHMLRVEAVDHLIEQYTVLLAPFTHVNAIK